MGGDKTEESPQPDAEDGQEPEWVTSKRDFRARAHSNPLNDGSFEPPLTPLQFTGTLPALLGRSDAEHENIRPTGVDWCDIGCGYGGLLMCLSPAFPNKTMIGFEIRSRVAEYCEARVLELRKRSASTTAAHARPYQNIGFVRTNAMKYLPNYFAKGTLEKLFFCYPDPHFKRRKHRQRIISDQLLAEYAYVLSPGKGVAYIVTDVPELFQWMCERFERCPLFVRRSSTEEAADSVTSFVRDKTDEAARVEKSDGSKQYATFLRVR